MTVTASHKIYHVTFAFSCLQLKKGVQHGISSLLSGAELRLSGFFYNVGRVEKSRRENVFTLSRGLGANSSLKSPFCPCKLVPGCVWSAGASA